MSPRRILSLVCVVLALGACASTVSDTTVSDTTTNPSVFNGAEGESGAENTGFGGVSDTTDATVSDTVAEAPESLALVGDGLEDRLGAMTTWLRAAPSAHNVGHEPLDAAPSGELHAHFLVDASTSEDAMALCEVYLDALDLHAGADAPKVQITLSGWVLTADGVFTDPGWAAITCNS